MPSTGREFVVVIAHIIGGKKAAADLMQALVPQIEAFTRTSGRPPGLDVIIVGEDKASQVYVRNKAKFAERVGIRSKTHRLPATAKQTEIEDLIFRVNQTPSTHAILLQLPLPPHLDALGLIEHIDPKKDVDGLHPHNVGLLWQGLREKALLPCTPSGCLRLLINIHGPDLSGKQALVIGRSNLVGKPMVALLLEHQATVTLAHSRTANLAALARQADILVAAVGRAGLVRGDWIKPGATVLDVGIHRVGDQLTGDVDFPAVAKVAGAVSPVPGGVGPMTIALLLENTLHAALRG